MDNYEIYKQLLLDKERLTRVKAPYSNKFHEYRRNILINLNFIRYDKKEFFFNFETETLTLEFYDEEFYSGSYDTYYEKIYSIEMFDIDPEYIKLCREKVEESALKLIYDEFEQFLIEQEKEEKKRKFQKFLKENYGGSEDNKKGM